MNVGDIYEYYNDGAESMLRSIRASLAARLEVGSTGGDVMIMHLVDQIVAKEATCKCKNS